MAAKCLAGHRTRDPDHRPVISVLTKRDETYADNYLHLGVESRVECAG